MDGSAYPAEVARLLTYGFAYTSGRWPDYVHELGLREEHIAALIRMATDDALLDTDSDLVESSAVAHAGRALGQLRSVEAVGPLLEVIERTQDDFLLFETPRVIGLIGAPALPTLAMWLADESRDDMATYAVITAASEVVKNAPHATQDVVQILVQRLEKYATNDFSVNALLVEALCTLRAKEALPLITQVYLRQRANVTMFHWDQVLDALE
jgi:hypothetical protein